MANINEIMDKYQTGEISLEEANAALKDSGLRLADLTDAERALQRERENAEGFIEPDTPSKKLPKEIDLSRRKDLAGQTVVQETAMGSFAVEYNEHGYAVKSTRVR